MGYFLYMKTWLANKDLFENKEMHISRYLIKILIKYSLTVTYDRTLTPRIWKWTILSLFRSIS